MRYALITLAIFSQIAALPPLARSQDPPTAEGRLGEEVETLLGQLLAERLEDRDDAYRRLVELAGPSPARAARVLDLLPEIDETMPPALVEQLNELRVEIETQIAESAIGAARVTLEVDQAPIAKVLSAIELATENKLSDYREQFGQEAKEKLISLELKEVPFWEAMDQVLDQAGMDVYAFSGEDSLALVNRDQGGAPRAGAACYAGPLRVAVTQVIATSNRVQPSANQLALVMDVSWEPRLRPIALTQKLAGVVATNEQGARLSLLRPEQSIDLELSAGNQATEIRLPFVLPKRKTEQVATLRGTLEVLAPGRAATFKFEKVASKAEPITRRQGGVEVTLAGVRKNNEVWEVHMRLKLDQPGEALASHRGWVYDNRTFLLDENGEEIDHAGFETTMQTQDTIGLAYLFDHEPGIEGLTWVYETPATVHRFPVEYELKEIALP